MAPSVGVLRTPPGMSAEAYSPSQDFKEKTRMESAARAGTDHAASRNAAARRNLVVRHSMGVMTASRPREVTLLAAPEQPALADGHKCRGSEHCGGLWSLLSG